MVERSENAGFTLEAGEPFWIGRELLEEELDCDLTTELQVLGSVDLAHASCTEGREDLLVAQPSTCF